MLAHARIIIRIHPQQIRPHAHATHVDGGEERLALQSFYHVLYVGNGIGTRVIASVDNEPRVFDVHNTRAQSASRHVRERAAHSPVAFGDKQQCHFVHERVHGSLDGWLEHERI